MPYPKKFDSQMTEAVTVRLTPHMKEYAEILAAKLNVGTADVFRMLLLEKAGEPFSLADVLSDYPPKVYEVAPPESPNEEA